MKSYVTCFLAIFLLLSAGCREVAGIDPPDIVPVDSAGAADGVLRGCYLLNEGNMGSNKASIDYFSFAEGVYSRNIYASANPSIALGLGDVGNDLAIYGSKMYAIINCSNKIEVMDKTTARRVGKIDIPNCRYICFSGGYAYVTSYAGVVEINPSYSQRGYVAKIDTSTLEIVDKCTVGYQPDGIAVVGGKLYVANSGGYMFPNYEDELSVIDLSVFREVKRIKVAINLHRLQADSYQQLWVTSRGNYDNVPARIYRVNTQTDLCEGMIDVGVSNFWLDGDSLYVINSGWEGTTTVNAVRCGIIDVGKKALVNSQLLGDAMAMVAMPYGIMVHPVSKDIFIADAGNYVYPGVLSCFTKEGVRKWQTQTGDVPAHFALLYE